MGSSSSRAINFSPETGIPDLTGKVVLVTGGNSGIGFVVIQQLVRHGAKVYMGARNEGKAMAAIGRLRATEGLGAGNGEVVWLKLDLSKPQDVLTAAQELMQKEERLDVLVNNAAILLVPFAKDHANIQNIVMVNYIGSCILTRALLPLLKRTAQEPNSDVRIVTVSTKSHKRCPSDARFRNLEDLNRDFEDTMFPQYHRYAFSKTMQLMFSKELQRRLDDAGVPVLCIATDPGEVRTEGVRAYTDSVGPIVGPLYRLIALLTFTTPAKGAHGPLFCSAAPIPRSQPNTYRGAYLEPPCTLTKCSALAAKDEYWTELWETTERVLRDIGVELPAL